MKHHLFFELIQQIGFRWEAKTNPVTIKGAIWDAYVCFIMYIANNIFYVFSFITEMP